MALNITNFTDEQLEDMLRKMMDFATVREFKGISDKELEAFYSWGLGFYKGGRYEDAEKIFRLLVILEHTSSRFWTALGGVQQVQRRFNEAVSSYRVATVLDIRNPKPMYYAAQCFLALGDRVNARSALLSLATYAPKDTETGRKFLAKGAALLKALDANEAKETDEKKEASHVG